MNGLGSFDDFQNDMTSFQSLDQTPFSVEQYPPMAETGTYVSNMFSIANPQELMQAQFHPEEPSLPQFPDPTDLTSSLFMETNSPDSTDSSSLFPGMDSFVNQPSPMEPVNYANFAQQQTPLTPMIQSTLPQTPQVGIPAAVPPTQPVAMSSQRATAVRKKGGSQTANAVSSRNYRQKKKAIQDEVTIKLKQYEQENYALKVRAQEQHRQFEKMRQTLEVEKERRSDDRKDFMNLLQQQNATHQKQVTDQALIIESQKESLKRADQYPHLPPPTNQDKTIDPVAEVSSGLSKCCIEAAEALGRTESADYIRTKALKLRELQQLYDDNAPDEELQKPIIELQEMCGRVLLAGTYHLKHLLTPQVLDILRKEGFFTEEQTDATTQQRSAVVLFNAANIFKSVDTLTEDQKKSIRLAIQTHLSNLEVLHAERKQIHSDLNYSLAQMTAAAALSLVELLRQNLLAEASEAGRAMASVLGCLSIRQLAVYHLSFRVEYMSLVQMSEFWKTLMTKKELHSYTQAQGSGPNPDGLKMLTQALPSGTINSMPAASPL